MTPAAIRTMVLEENADALFADGFDDALIGAARRCGQPTLACYSYNHGIDVLVSGGMDLEEAIEHMEFNVVGAWVGPNTPVWVSAPDDDGEE